MSCAVDMLNWYGLRMHKREPQDVLLLQKLKASTSQHDDRDECTQLFEACLDFGCKQDWPDCPPHKLELTRKLLDEKFEQDQQDLQDQFEQDQQAETAAAGAVAAESLQTQLADSSALRMTLDEGEV